MEQQKQTWHEEEEDGALRRRQSRQHSNPYNGNENGTHEAEITEENEHNKSVYFETHQGDASVHGVSGVECSGTKSSVSESTFTEKELDIKTNKFEIQRIPSTETDCEPEKDLANESLSALSPLLVQKLHDQNITNLEDLNNTAEVDAEVDLVEEIDNEFADLDVERILQKQNTHHLYCPNCNSCITRRVVLRRRKQRVRNIRRKPKPELETPSELDLNFTHAASGQDLHKVNVSSNSHPSAPSDSQGPIKLHVSSNSSPTPSANGCNNERQLTVSPTSSPTSAAANDNNDTQLNVSPNGTPAPPANGQDNDRQPELLFRCLSCFSLFIPTGNGCKLFQCFGGSDEDGNGQDVQNRPASKKNWFLNIFSSGVDVVIDVEPQPFVPQLVEPQPVESHPVQTQPDQAQLGTPVEAHDWDILKSIVYGGLIESITSLGVVSSAAGAGATTLKILAMGLANVIAGLFIVVHNLKELKNDHTEDTSNQVNEQESRYRQILGRRQNFSRHVIAVVLSFLIFGLVPPVIYGFSFRKSDNRDLKLAAVAGSSFAIIALLAVAKGHVQKPPRSYLSTVLYYLSLGVMASGLSYVAGNLFEKFIEKLGLFVSSSEVAVHSLDVGLMKPTWSAY